MSKLREKNLLIFTDTLDISKEKYPYNEEYESINRIKSLPEFIKRDFNLHVTNNDCIDDIVHDKQGILVNSASMKHPGGGVTRGSSAQEEEICRRSNMFLGLQNVDNDLQYPLHDKTIGIHFPNITFFKKSKDLGYMLEHEPFQTDIVALFSRPKSFLEETSFEYHCKAFQPLIYFANKYKAEYIVLPPIGCGVFGNDPSDVARALYKVLTTFQLETVKDIYVSCYKKEPNYNAFSYEFKKWKTNVIKSVVQNSTKTMDCEYISPKIKVISERQSCKTDIIRSIIQNSTKIMDGVVIPPKISKPSKTIGPSELYPTDMSVEVLNNIFERQKYKK